jgi:hypothetical protein
MGLIRAEKFSRRGSRGGSRLWLGGGGGLEGSETANDEVFACFFETTY